MAGTPEASSTLLTPRADRLKNSRRLIFIAS
jgi:hypothetical protein